jgi:hypothetical protein
MNDSQNDRFYFTVGQLLEVLKTLPADLPVLVSGYESGYENFYHPSIIKVCHEPENLEFEGEFQAAQDKKRGTFDAVVLQRVMRD